MVGEKKTTNGTDAHTDHIEQNPERRSNLMLKSPLA